MLLLLSQQQKLVKHAFVGAKIKTQIMSHDFKVNCGNEAKGIFKWARKLSSSKKSMERLGRVVLVLPFGVLCVFDTSEEAIFLRLGSGSLSPDPS